MFETWSTYFQHNRTRQVAIEETVDWGAPCELDDHLRVAFVRSLRRFERGEDGDGRRLLAHAMKRDIAYADALALLVAEEQRHSALFRRGLAHLGAQPLRAHWSEIGFVLLRRLMGLRTEVLAFLVAETVAMEYFEALRDAAPDPVLRGIGVRIATDEVEHIRFQVDGLRVLFADSGGASRMLAAAGGWLAAAAAATVLVIDHRDALRACGLRPAGYWARALRRYRVAAGQAFGRARVPEATEVPAGLSARVGRRPRR